MINSRLMDGWMEEGTYQVFTCASVIFNPLASEALSADARYFCLRNRRSSSLICCRVNEVRGFLRLGGVRFWYGWPIRRGIIEDAPKAATAAAAAAWCELWCKELRWCDCWAAASWAWSSAEPSWLNGWDPVASWWLRAASEWGDSAAARAASCWWWWCWCWWWWWWWAAASWWFGWLANWCGLFAWFGAPGFWSLLAAAWFCCSRCSLFCCCWLAWAAAAAWNACSPAASWCDPNMIDKLGVSRFSAGWTSVLLLYWPFYRLDCECQYLFSSPRSIARSLACSRSNRNTESDFTKIDSRFCAPSNLFHFSSRAQNSNALRNWNIHDN